MDTIAGYAAWKAKKQSQMVAGTNVVLGSLTQPPDEVAGDMSIAEQYAKATGAPQPPPSMVRDFRPIFQQRIEAARNSTILSASPILTEWLRKPENAAVARDDLEHMSAFESTVQNVKDAGRAVPGGIVAAPGIMAEGAGTLIKNAPEGLSALTAPVDPAERTSMSVRIAQAGKKTPEEIAALRSEIFKQGAVNPTVAQSVLSDVLSGDMTPEEAMQALEPLLSPALDAISKGALKANAIADPIGTPIQQGGIAISDAAAKILPPEPGREDSLGTQVGSGLGYMLALIGITAATGGAGGLASAGLGGAGESAQRARQAGADEDTQALAALAGILPGLTDAIPIERLFNNPATRAGIGSFLRSVGTQTLVEGGQEAVQQVMQNMIAQALYQQEGGTFDGVLDSFASGGLVGAITEAGKEAMLALLPGRFHAASRHAAEAPAARQLAEDLSTQAQTSKVRERSTTVFREFVDRQAEGSPVENVYVPARKFVELFQSTGQDPFEVAGSLSGVDPDELYAMYNSGGDLKIPLSTYMTDIAGTDIDQQMIENMRFDHDGMTPQEADEFNAKWEDAKQEMLDLAEEQRRMDEQQRQTEDVIREEVHSRLRVQNVSQNEASSVALAYASFYRTVAARNDMTVDELLQVLPIPEFRGTVPQGVQSRNVDDLTRSIAEARMFRGAASDKRASLADFIAEYGGINDPGGELRAMGADKIKRGRKTIKLARDTSMQGQGSLAGMAAEGGKKHGIDDVARAAIEAGYLANDPVANDYRAALVEGREVPDIGKALLDALAAEMRGQADFADAQASDAQTSDRVASLEEYLSNLGVSLSDSDQKIRAAVEADQAREMRRYGQGAVDMTETPEFKAWFGDSKVVDENGKPLVVYHGTAADFEAFDNSKTGKNDRGLWGRGHYLSSSPVTASSYAMREGDGARIIPAYASIQNPFIVKTGADLITRLPDGTNVRDLLGPNLDGAKIKEIALSGGHDGVIQIKPNGEIGDIVAFDATQIKSVYNQGTFNPADPRILYQKERGSILLPANGQGPAIISLFEGRDLSTLLHETGHWFLYATQQLAKAGKAASLRDMEAAKTWWRENAADVARDGMRVMPDVTVTAEDVIASLDNGTTGDVMKDAAIDVGMQEQWARGFEAYLMDGKAPSVELRSMFEKFRSWLLYVYRKVRGDLNVNVSPEISAIFDRMLASDEAIAKARDRSGAYIPAYLSAETFGLTDQEFEQFRRAIERQADEEKAKALVEAMGPIRRETEAWFKEERARVRKEVTTEFQNMPIYRAIQQMRFGKGFDGAELPRIRLDRDTIVNEYGLGHLPLLPGATNQGKGHASAVFGPDGLHPDTVAEMFGFENGEQFLHLLENAPEIGEAIKAETEKRLFTLHGDPLRDGSIEEKALEAVHGENGMKALEIELRAITEIAELPDSFISAKDAREAARRTLPGMMVRDAQNSARFLSYERKAGDEAERLGKQVTRNGSWVAAAARRLASKSRSLAKGEGNVEQVNAAADALNAKLASTTSTFDVAEQKRVSSSGKESTIPGGMRTVEKSGYNDLVQRYADAKRRQLMNRALYAESRKVAKEVEKIEARVEKLNKSDKALGARRDLDYIKAARQIAAAYGLAKPDPRFQWTEWLAAAKEADPVRVADIENLINDNLKGAKPYKEMTFDELRGLAATLDAIMETAKNTRNLEIEGRTIERKAALEELHAPLENMPEKMRNSLEQAYGWKDRMIKRFYSFTAGLKRAESWARMMDQGEIGPYTRYLVKPIMDAADAYRVVKADKIDKLAKIITSRLDAAQRKSFAAPELGYTFRDKGEIFMAVLHSGNDSNFEKLLMGRKWTVGLTGQTQKVTAKGKLSFDRKGNAIMTRGAVDATNWNAFMSRMIDQGVWTKEDMDAVQEIWDLTESLKIPAMRAFKKMYGYYFPTIEPTAVETPWGRYRGGYIPAIADSDASSVGALRADMDALDSQSAASMFPSTGKGFTNARKANTDPLSLNLSILPAHVDKVLRFTHLEPVVKQTHSLVLDRNFRETLDRVAPGVASGTVVKFLGAAAQQSSEIVAMDGFGKTINDFARVVRTRVGIHTMFLNIVNGLQQIPQLLVAMTRVSPSRLKNAMIFYAKRGPTEMMAEMKSRSRFMASRMDERSHLNMAAIQEIASQRTIIIDEPAWVRKFGYVFQSMIQAPIDTVVWHAAYDQEIAAGASDKDAAYRADEIIRTVMGDFNPENLASFERSYAAVRAVTMFASFFNGQANGLASQAKIIMDKYGWHGAPRLFWLYLMGMAAPAIVAEAIASGFRGDLDDPDEDGYADELLDLFFGSQARYAAAMIPVVGQIGTAAVRAWDSLPYNDSISVSPVVSTLQGAVRAPVSVYNAATGQGTASKAVGDGLAVLALVTGVPLGALSKIAKYGADVAEGRAKPEGPADLLQGALTGRDGTQ